MLKPTPNNLATHSSSLATTHNTTALYRYILHNGNSVIHKNVRTIMYLVLDFQVNLTLVLMSSYYTAQKKGSVILGLVWDSNNWKTEKTKVQLVFFHTLVYHFFLSLSPKSPHIFFFFSSIISLLTCLTYEFGCLRWKCRRMQVPAHLLFSVS